MLIPLPVGGSGVNTCWCGVGDSDAYINTGALGVRVSTDMITDTFMITAGVSIGGGRARKISGALLAQTLFLVLVWVFFKITFIYF